MKKQEHRFDPIPARSGWNSPARRTAAFLLCLLLFGAGAATAQDEIELLSGSRLAGKIVERTATSVKIEVEAGGRVLTRSYPLARVKAITQNGRREVLAEAGATEASRTPGSGRGLGLQSRTVERSPEEVAALIESMGRTPPDWLAETPLDFPSTLDLSWPEPAPEIWNYTRNVDHYIWDIINSNSNRYRSGIRFMEHLLSVNADNPSVRARAMNELGRMYYEFFQDYPRAAFWWREAQVDRAERFLDSPSPARLAECYWRLGNRAMAVELLERLPLTLAVIKVWADLKETEKALGLCEEALRRGLPSSQVYLAAGDACRNVKDFERATEYYRKVLELSPAGERKTEIERDQSRARDTLEVIRLFDTLEVSRIPDGTYTGKSLGYSGEMEVEAVVSGGRLESLRVVRHNDRQYYHAIDEAIRRIMTKQSVSGIDAVSGATITSEAVVRAAAKALGEGGK